MVFFYAGVVLSGFLIILVLVMRHVGKRNRLVEVSVFAVLAAMLALGGLYML